MAKVKKTNDVDVESSKIFHGDFLKKYGKIIENGQKVLKDLTELKTISISPMLDMALGGGLREGSVVVMTGDPKTGKDQPLTATVYTPDGPKKMGSLKVGEYVCTPDGGLAKINAIFPQGVKDIYRITFEDDTSVECGLDHLWKAYEGLDHNYQIISLRDIIERMQSYPEEWKIPYIVEDGSTSLRTIREIQIVRQAETQCISIDSKDGLYLTDNFTVTHNTTSALHFVSKCQAIGKNIMYFNTEGRITKENFLGIRGLDPSKITVVQATDEQPVVSAENFLNSLEHCIKNVPDLVCIVDSVSNMVPQEELEGEIRTGVRNSLPRLLSMFCKRISSDVHRNKAIIIFITHNITNTAPASKYSPSKVADCGVMIQYQAGTNMVITHRGKWEVPKDSGNHVGQTANWIIKTSAAGGKPNSTAESWIRYGVGIDETQEIAQLATDFSFIKSSGSWYDITYLSENKDKEVVKKFLEKQGIDISNDEQVCRKFKFQGMEKLTIFLEENLDLRDFIYAGIKELVS